MSKRVFIVALCLAGARLAAFFAIFLNQSHDAQWQLLYYPLWIADLPISLLYYFAKAPIPWAEGIIGPLWWFCLPIIISRLFRRWASQ